jgi:ComF family protein
VVPLGPPWCDRCGLPAERPISSCAGCPPREVAAARAPFLFAGPVRAAVHRLKFSGWRAVAEALGAAMVAIAPATEPDAIAWVPLSRRRLRRRGFDQAERLADAVGARLGIPVLPLLIRTTDSSPQARRGGAERRTALVGAFRVSRRPPAEVLLVDDVLTTGATAAACARALLDAGVGRVALLTAARAASRATPARYTQPGSRPGLWLPGEEAPR